jgi:hypothetical protein
MPREPEGLEVVVEDSLSTRDQVILVVEGEEGAVERYIDEKDCVSDIVRREVVRDRSTLIGWIDGLLDGLAATEIREGTRRDKKGPYLSEGDARRNGEEVVERGEEDETGPEEREAAVGTQHYSILAVVDAGEANRVQPLYLDVLSLLHRLVALDHLLSQ